MGDFEQTKIIRGEDADNALQWQPPAMKGQQRLKPKAKAKAKAKPSPAAQKPATPTKSAKQPVTVGQLDKLQQTAYDEGFAQGRKEGKERGLKEGLDASKQQVRKKLKQLDGLLNALNTPFDELDDQVEEEIVTLVIKMVRQLVRREVKTDSHTIAGVVREALAALPVNARNIHVLLNPLDAGLLRELYDMSEADQNWTIREDPTIQRGGCKVVTETSQIDATLDSRLDHLIAPLLSSERHTADDDTDEGGA